MGELGGQKGHMSEKCAYTLILPTTNMTTGVLLKKMWSY